MPVNLPMTNHPRPHRTGLRAMLAGDGPLIACSLLLLVFSPGCRLVQTAVDVPGQTVRAITPGKQGQPAADPVELQQTLLRFADEYLTRMASSMDKLRQGNNAVDRAKILQSKIDIGTATCSIASGPNPIANLLDMTIFVTVTRASLEEYWVPEVFGESARPLLDGARNAEAEIWRLIATALTREQQSELHRTIEMWRRQNPQPESIVSARAVGFASQVAKAGKDGKSRSDSLLNLLSLDPLTGLDPAVREVAQTRLFAERALFVTQKLPMLLRWQTELLSVNAVQLPAVQQLITNTTQITASVERFAAVAEKLPAQVSIERQEILKALESQERALTPLVNEVKQTLSTGSQMSTSLNMTLTTFDALMKRFGVGEADVTIPPKTNAEPFRIQDYTATAVQMEATARQLTELLVTLDRTVSPTNLAQLSAQVSPVIQSAQAGGREVVDHAFRKGLLLLLVAVVAALLYRFLSLRITAAHSNSKSP